MQTTTAKHTIRFDSNTHHRIYADRDRLSQVIVNLISNAIKYSPEAHDVIVSLTESQEGLDIHVQDFGIGIPSSHVDKIFQRFYRVFDATDQTFPGLGMGLYISAEIIERHGGTLSVKSEQGKGSVFFVHLPFHSTRE